ncbi:MAG: hypothetical protein AAF552_07885 [Pseudomonadota bacterium]
MTNPETDPPELIAGRPLLGIALIGVLGLVAVLGHQWLIPRVEDYVPRAACDRWLGTNGLSALLLTVTAGAGVCVVLFGVFASRYWARVVSSGQLPPPGALVFRTVRPVRLANVPARARVARFLPHLSGVMLAVCVAMGLSLHWRLVSPNLTQFQALCSEQSSTP